MIKLSEADKQLAGHLIEKYRELVNKRYQYEAISGKLELSERITPEVVTEIRYYFLHHLYPDSAERKQLEEAFQTLAGYINQPAKVWGLLGNFAKAIFIFGRHLPAALKAGIITLESFLAAQKLEYTLLDSAKEMELTEPLSNEEFIKCLAYIPKSQLNTFIKDLYVLFNTLTNTKLLKKTIYIMEDVVKRMKRRPILYPAKEVEGVMLGISILKEGYNLFIKYDDSLKKEIADKIKENELAFFDEIYATNGAV